MDKRFVKILGEGAVNVTEVWVDTQTGVNYLYHASGYAGGMTVLLGADGKPVISNIGDVSERQPYNYDTQYEK